MGIEKFFNALRQNNVTNTLTSFTNVLERQEDIKYLYLDFNSIIYTTFNKVISDLNYLLYKIVTGHRDKKSIKIIEQYDLKIADNITPKEYHDMFPQSKMDEIMLHKIHEYVINMLTNYIKPDKLELLYIGIDGVPSKSKMQEQKSRRYMGTITSIIDKKIFAKHEDELKK